LAHNGQIQSDRVVHPVSRDLSGQTLGWSANKSVLGSMNDLAFHYNQQLVPTKVIERQKVAVAVVVDDWSLVMSLYPT